MGLSASQARFLGLTARKTNVEYEGQQINQQRTALGNQTANYYNQMLGMSVPVPPAIDSFTKTVYTFNDGALSNSITSMIAQDSGIYNVSYLREWVDDFSVVSAASSVVTFAPADPDTNKDDAVATDFRIGSEQLATLGDDTDRTGAYWESLTAEEQAQLIEEEQAYEQLLDTKYGDSDWAVRYTQNTTTGAYVPQFYKVDDLRDAMYDADTSNTQSHIPAFTPGSEKKTEEIKNVSSRVEQDSTGRLINITLYPDYVDADNPGEGVSYALTTNTIADQEKYNDAMNQYEYEKYQYDQTINEINAKIAIIQSQDKNLELRLKQLDTEQNAIQTEMDAVTKVIQKNVETTFKTFG